MEAMMTMKRIDIAALERAVGCESREHSEAIG